MATKRKVETFVVRCDEEFLDGNLEITGLEDFCYNTESEAIKTSQEALLDNANIDSLVVYKLVPVVSVKRAAILVEKL